MPNMNKVPSAPKKQRALIEDGQQVARIVQVIDLGLQNQRPFQGQEKPPAYELYITLEFPDQRIEIDGESKPMWKSTRFKLSSDDRSTCYKWYTRLDPKNNFKGEWTDLINTPCLAFITHQQGKGKNSDRVFDNISDINGIVKGMTVAPLENDPVVFDLMSPNMEVFESLPDFLQGIIKENLEYDGSKLQRKVEGEPARVTASVGDGEDYAETPKEAESKTPSPEESVVDDENDPW